MWHYDLNPKISQKIFSTSKLWYHIFLSVNCQVCVCVIYRAFKLHMLWAS